MEESGAFKGPEEEPGVWGKTRLLMEEEFSVGVELSDVTILERLGMIGELEYRCS